MSSESVDLEVDVTEAAGLGEKATIAVTVHLPDPATLPEKPVICIAKPGAGYSKNYFGLALPGPATGSQAEWHTSRGWIFVAVDPLGVGASSTHHDPTRLVYEPVVAAARAAEQEVLRRLADGSLDAGFPAVAAPVVLGIGQSLGGLQTVLQQGRYHSYDGIGVLGFSAIHARIQSAPGKPPVRSPWIPRDIPPASGLDLNPQQATWIAEDWHLDPEVAWCFHYDDVDAEVVRADLTDYPVRGSNPPPWASTTVPVGVVMWCSAPGAMAPEAAAVSCPVLVVAGERDLIPDLRAEPNAYRNAPSVDLFACPRAGHMHNFAGTRELVWDRIHNWGSWVRTYHAAAGPVDVLAS